MKSSMKRFWQYTFYIILLIKYNDKTSVKRKFKICNREQYKLINLCIRKKILYYGILYFCYSHVCANFNAYIVAAGYEDKLIKSVLNFSNSKDYKDNKNVGYQYDSNEKQEKKSNQVMLNEFGQKSMNNFNQNSKSIENYESMNSSSNFENVSGKYLGAPCESACAVELQHVVCDLPSNTCICENNYPVIIDMEIGCGKPKKLGEQCFYHQTCIYNDEYSRCIQVNHNAFCQCANGFHSVSYSKPTKRVFCTQDIAVLTSNLPTLLGVTTGIAILAGLICLVLHLFSKTKYPRHRNVGNSNILPRVVYSNNTGLPLLKQTGRISCRSSMGSTSSTSSYCNRDSSGTQQSNSKGILVSTSRTDAARCAAILLISSQVLATSTEDHSRGDSSEILTKHLQKQLRHQKQLLHLELLSATSRDKIKTVIKINGTDEHDEEYNSTGSGNVRTLPTPASETAKFADYHY